MKNILIRGKPGSGKTTLIIKIVKSIKNKTARDRVATTGGFYTEEIRKNRGRVGFAVKTLNGEDGILSHIHPIAKKATPWLSNGKRFKSGPRVGKYRVDINVIDKLIVDSIEEAVKNKDIVIIDEIGKMEMFSGSFKSEVKKALDSDKKVIATVPIYSNPFLDSLTSRNDIEIFDLDVNNRDNIFEDILKRL